MLQSHKACTTCEKAQHAKDHVQTVCYKFMGHNARYITRELSTYFHACFDKTFSPVHGWQAFPTHFRVCDFLIQQSRVLQFDNQLHVSHWNLVHVVPRASPGQLPVYEILDSNKYMNSIPAALLQQLEIHAVDLELHARQYYAHLTTPPHATALRGADTTFSTIQMVFQGHDEHDINKITHSPIHFEIETPVSMSTGRQKFPETLRVCDFLQAASDRIGRDNQLHVSQWNLVHVSALSYPNGDKIYKILDHYLYMNSIPDAFLCRMEIHAVHVVPLARYYLEATVSNEFMEYFSEHTLPTILYDDIQHPYGPPDNGHYYRQQMGGHGLFGSTGPEYNQNGEYTGLHFSRHVQDHPLRDHTPEPHAL